ncbi:Aste57867_17699 [Aphanomyces stellatus]|uniref:Aste57867_17699 protein n=1 Tax=Aphanomyces stellatus TaxID=120398 RepID=A0A485L8B7_9STRA|nr:hypothetical protein As57867_017638 [Aphanomyces stellatus]VFT94449.1 Aste57867_17699 [Aphanomyces stellatus]
MCVKRPHHGQGLESFPLELLWKVAAWIPDSTTFFSLLEALGSSSGRGPFEPLWQIGMTWQPQWRSRLWPQLGLSQNLIQDDVNRAYVEASLAHCPSALINFVWDNDIEWLVRHVRPPIALEWDANLPSTPSDARGNGVEIPLEEWYAKWAQLPITTLVRRSMCSIVREHIVEVLPQCRYLTTVTFHDAFPLASLFKFAASSGTLVHLTTSYATASSADLEDAIRWLASTPVQSFRCTNWTFDAECATAIEFVTAILQHPTMSLLLFSSSTNLNVDELPLLQPTRLRDLHLGQVSSCLRSLASAISHSSLERLLISNGHNVTASDEYVCAMVEVLKAAGLCKHLKILELPGPVLQLITVEELSLSMNGIGGNVDGVLWVGRAIHVSTAIQTVDLTLNDITKEGVMTLLKQIGDRRASPLTISLKSTRIVKANRAYLIRKAREKGIQLTI